MQWISPWRPALAQSALVLLALVAVPLTTDAQTRVDTARTDTLRRPGAPVDTQPKPPVPLLDSAAQARAQRRIDSIAAFKRGDTIKAPIAQFERPLSLDVDEKLRFTRDQILSTEATNLSELLARVPGVTHFATGWIASAQVAAYAGDFARVRVFMDGVEMDQNDTRSNGIPDLIDVHLWMLDEVVIERAAGEIRVWCRSTSVLRTTPYTRTDVFTGDLNTNGFRAVFARRFMNGMILQVNGEQYATQQGRQSQFGTTTTGVARGDGGSQLLNARIGYARKKISFDLYGTVTTRDRDAQTAIDSSPGIAAYKGARREGYVRLGYGDTSSGLWSHVVFNSLRTRLEGIRDPEDTTDTPSDTTRSREQKMFAIGYRTKSMQLSFTERLRTFDGKAWHSPAIRAGYTTKWLSAGAFVERQALDSSSHVDGTVRVQPLPWLAATVSQTVRAFDDHTAEDDSRRKNEEHTRIEGGVKWRNRWFTAGAIRHNTLLQKPPTLLVGQGVGRFIVEPSVGVTFGARGKLYKEIGIDFQGVRWTNTPLYRPQFSTRTDLSLVTNWLSRFPRNEFGVNFHIIHELRDPILFAFPSDTVNKPKFVQSLRAQVFTSQLEIRIQRATIFYQFRNFTGQPYELVPGIVMPRQVQMYGVRWEFWN